LHDGIQFDFHAPFGIEELSHNDHRGRRADALKKLTVDATDSFPVCGMGEIHSGPDYIVKGRACALEDFGGDLEYLAGLGFYVLIIGADRAGSGYVDGIADAYGAGKADDWLEWGASAEVLAGHGASIQIHGLDPQDLFS
jgi:hypothetical protein